MRFSEICDKGGTGTAVPLALESSGLECWISARLSRQGSRESRVDQALGGVGENFKA